MASEIPAINQVIIAAQKEAQRLGFPFIQREQLFLGLLQHPTVTRILTGLGLDLQSTREAVETRLLPGLGAPDDLSAIGMLPTAEQVCRQRALTAAALLGHTHTGPEHILLGFMLEQHGLVLEVLASLGVTKEKIVEAINRLDR
ncbi:MAG TPA: Clp protease N-terminal domain-containing protein [Symbiobacteriaceae bacterium]|nr:Clp protease N-terminal domain-containing protein [Symbiobacteriaceae bacterium]